MMSYANVTNMGFSKFISLGNKMDVDEFDAIQYLATDESTNVIMLYLESFSQPRKFYKYCKSITKDKPVIAVKSGRTKRGAKAAVSHTGALASADVIIDAAMKSSGVIRADSIQEMFDTAHALNKLKNVLPKGRRVAVISNAGGPGTIATDAVIKAGFIVDDFTGPTIAKLVEFLPVEASTTNPVDVLPSSGPTGYARSIEIMIQDPNIDIILVVFLPPVIVGIDKMLRGVNEVARLSSKPIIGCFLNGDCNLIKYDYLTFPVFEYSETAVQVMLNLLEYNQFKNADVNYTKFEIPVAGELEKHIIEASEQNTLLEQDDTISLLTNYGFKYPKTLIIDSKDQLSDFLDDYDLGRQSVVIKMACKTISHKSDAGGVKLNLASLEEIDVAINVINTIYEDRNVPMDDRKIMIQEFINLKNGVEVALGINRDSQFGSAVMIALGGIYIEVLKDSEFRMVPITDREAYDMVTSLKGRKILEGYRLPFEIDLELYKDQILRLSQLAADYPVIEELDINPLFVNDNGAYVLDARISVSKI
jgi:acetyltransferase